MSEKTCEACGARGADHLPQYFAGRQEKAPKDHKDIIGARVCMACIAGLLNGTGGVDDRIRANRAGGHGLSKVCVNTAECQCARCKSKEASNPFKVGDRVRVGRGYSHYTGCTGTVTTVGDVLQVVIDGDGGRVCCFNANNCEPEDGVIGGEHGTAVQCEKVPVDGEIKWVDQPKPENSVSICACCGSVKRATGFDCDCRWDNRRCVTHGFQVPKDETIVVEPSTIQQLEEKLKRLTFVNAALAMVAAGNVKGVERCLVRAEVDTARFDFHPYASASGTVRVILDAAVDAGILPAETRQKNEVKR